MRKSMATAQHAKTQRPLTHPLHIQRQVQFATDASNVAPVKIGRCVVRGEVHTACVTRQIPVNLCVKFKVTAVMHQRPETQRKAVTHPV